jgi:hypothetical protein
MKTDLSIWKTVRVSEALDRVLAEAAAENCQKVSELHRRILVNWASDWLRLRQQRRAA